MRALENILRQVAILVVVGLAVFFGVNIVKSYDFQVPTSVDAALAIRSIDQVVLPKATAPTTPAAVPAAPVATAPAPSLVAPANPADFHFMAGTDANPARFDPCAPVHYLVNDAGVPGALADTQEAFTRLGAATGITFVFDGTTTQVATSAWGQNVKNPILVSWADPAQSDLLDPSASANGGGDRIGNEYMTGSVVVNIHHDHLYAPGFGPGQMRGNLLLHELAHVMGLDHAHEPGQIMYGSISTTTPDGYSAGDLAGLRKLGVEAGCL